MFVGFTNFYRQFIYRFSKIAAPLILILKISENEVAFILHILEIGALLGKDNNIINNGSGDDNSIMTVRKSDEARNLALKLGFLTSRAMIAFA